jgi:hypothetical protein
MIEAVAGEKITLVGTVQVVQQAVEMENVQNMTTNQLHT